MKRILPISSVPNQEFSFSANRTEVSVSLTTAYDLLFADISVNRNLVCAGVKCIGGVSLIPKRIESMLGGRLYFDATSGEYPTYNILNTKDCALVFEEF